ncbi:MAG: hypothetical protein MR545_03005 [Veillonellaceae bacterium]|nr:hypothetical protein [Veillonellaceae bacterium]
MSKWTDFRDDIVESLQVEEVTEQVKQNLTKQIVESILPSVKTVADGFTAKIKEQAKAETGWCKIRDMFVLPLVINGVIYVVETVLTKTLEKTTT